MVNFEEQSFSGNSIMIFFKTDTKRMNQLKNYLSLLFDLYVFFNITQGSSHLLLLLFLAEGGAGVVQSALGSVYMSPKFKFCNFRSPDLETFGRPYVPVHSCV